MEINEKKRKLMKQFKNIHKAAAQSSEQRNPINQKA
jgi:hypothetical protein